MYVIMLCYVNYAMLYNHLYDILCDLMLCYVMLCYVMLCYVMLCYYYYYYYYYYIFIIIIISLFTHSNTGIISLLKH